MLRQTGWFRVSPNRQEINIPVGDNYKRSREMLEKAIGYLGQGNKTVLVDAKAEMGALCRDQGKYEDAIECYERSIELAQENENQYSIGHYGQIK